MEAVLLVGIALDRTADMMVALLGVHKAGAAYVPLDPAFPSERLATILTDSGMPLVVTQRSLRAALPVGQARVVELDGADAAARHGGRSPVDALANSRRVDRVRGRRRRDRGGRTTWGAAPGDRSRALPLRFKGTRRDKSSGWSFPVAEGGRSSGRVSTGARLSHITPPTSTTATATKTTMPSRTLDSTVQRICDPRAQSVRQGPIASSLGLLRCSPLNVITHMVKISAC